MELSTFLTTVIRDNLMSRVTDVTVLTIRLMRVNFSPNFLIKINVIKEANEESYRRDAFPSR